MKPDEHRTLLDVDQAADYLNVSVRFMRRMIAQRRITHHKIGKFVRFDQAVLDTWIDDHTVPARQPHE